jgi:basic membrane protein A and related proteins
LTDADYAYTAARRNGVRAHNHMVSLGRPGNLPYLDELLLDNQVASREYLGVVDVPLKKIIGTYTAGRSMSFAENFMPLLAMGTEFSAKWRAVYNYQLAEGIRDAVKVYEFLNRYYVVEGNKRVSVLKFIDAAGALADVTRLVPKYDENDETVKLYYEFLDFYRETRINTIWLSAPGGYKTLLGLIRGIDVPKADKADPCKYFLSTYYMPFRTILYDLGGDRLPLTTGDIFLRYFNLYKLHRRMGEKEMRKRLRALCEELGNSLGFREEDVNTKPEEVPEPSLISSIIGIVKPKQPIKIAFAYSGNREVSNWAKAHELGRLHIQKELQDDILTTYADNVSEDIGAYKVFKTLIEDGYGIIFATSPAFANAALRTALEFPQAKIFLCSEQHPSRHVHTYFGRIYEPRFLTGIIAGALTRTDKIGYVGSYPVKGVISGVNAFALGARLVNPRAKILVSWAYQWDFAEAATHYSGNLIDAGADIISHQNTFTGAGFEGEYGLFSMACDTVCAPDEYIATPVWNWGVFYELMVRNILSGAHRNSADMRPMQFWWGMDSGIVDILYAKKYVPLETHRLVTHFKRMLKEGAYNPFTGPILDRDGVERLAAGETADAKQIITMDWFVDGIEGDVPAMPADWAGGDVTSELLEL